MPEQVQCPKCNQKLRVPDNLLGKKVKCPKCASIFEAKDEEAKDEEDGGSYGLTQEPEPQPRSKALRRASGEDVEDEEEEDEPVRKKRRPAAEDTEDDELEEDEEERRPKKKRPKRSRALDKVLGPALGLQITAVLGMLAIAAHIIFFIFAVTQVGRNQKVEAPVMAGVIAAYGCGYLFVFLVQIAVLVGASRLKRLESYREALLISIFCFLPCTFCFLGLPMGIWTIVAINSDEVRPFFRA
jgi:zinc-ribbon domain